jgi:catechol 2,3-dioxygenase-like lactoylglutathione lyase family enzyme
LRRRVAWPENANAMPLNASPPLAGVLETALYVDDMGRARAFYEGVLGLEPMFTDDRLTAYPVGGRSALLIFRRGAATETAHLPGGTIPPHDGAGPIHCAFSIAADALPTWEEHFAARGVAVEGRTEWGSSKPARSISIYFRDPDGHLLELATPGLWPRLSVEHGAPT